MTAQPANLRGLSAGAVHIWHIDLLPAGERIPDCRNFLADEDLQRAERFHFDRDRRRFVAAHAAMRNILAQYLGVSAREILFHAAEKGKPQLGSSLSRSGLRFNLSHSHDRALLALARDSEIGVDIEFIKPQSAGEEIANRFFSSREAAVLGSLPPASRVPAFFHCWTRKEAYIKAIGGGLSVPLDSFDVAFGPGESARLLRVDGAPEELSRWSMYDVPVRQGYAAAVVVEGQQHRLEQREWDWNSF